VSIAAIEDDCIDIRSNFKDITKDWSSFFIERQNDIMSNFMTSSCKTDFLNFRWGCQTALPKFRRNWNFEDCFLAAAFSNFTLASAFLEQVLNSGILTLLRTGTFKLPLFRRREEDRLGNPRRRCGGAAELTLVELDLGWWSERQLQKRASKMRVTRTRRCARTQRIT
jgi:hypothetical protein